MKKTAYTLFLNILILFPKAGFAQTFISGIETIIENEAYVVHSEQYFNSKIFNTSNIYLFKGLDQTVWIFGTGYGEVTDIQFYRNNPDLTTSGATSDASLINSVIQNNFGISNTTAILQFIVPHFHLDHINQELITELEVVQNYNLTNSNIYVHANDYYKATCNLPCCGETPCDGNSPNFGSPYTTPWEAPTLSKFVSIGQPTDSCNQFLMTIPTSYGFWEVLKGDVLHTSGTLNIVNSNYKLKILGAHLGTECETPDDWQLLEIHGDLNMDDIIILSTIENQTNSSSDLKIYPNPANNNVTFKIANINPLINGKILIYDNVGNEILKTNFNTNRISINLEWQPGVYFVKAVEKSGLRMATKKLIIK